MRKRTQARELVLQVLYQIELRGKPDQNIDLASYIPAENADPEINNFVLDLVKGCLEHQASIDEEIKKVSLNWNISRMGVIDRIALRLGVYELLFQPETPPVVAINEAIDLVKKYGDKDSGSFVNGILDKIHQTLKVKDK